MTAKVQKVVILYSFLPLKFDKKSTNFVRFLHFTLGEVEFK